MFIQSLNENYYFSLSKGQKLSMLYILNVEYNSSHFSFNSVTLDSSKWKRKTSIDLTDLNNSFIFPSFLHKMWINSVVDKLAKEKKTKNSQFSRI